MKRYFPFFLVGILLGVVFIKSEVASWFRIYEMFNFKSFHMYGIIGSALLLGSLITAVFKFKKTKSFKGNPITFQAKDKSFTRYSIGGVFFGLGWALGGSCPGPMFALAGAGFVNILFVIIGALLGTYVYGLIRDKLPH